MKKIMILFLCMVNSILAKPLPPYSLPLDKHGIQTIPIHTEIDTLLIFSSEIESVIGNGLTTGGEVAGSVLYQQGEKNPKTIVLRHLDSASQVLMTVMIGDTAYVFRLMPDASPASVVYLQDSDAEIPKAVLVSEEEILLASRPISEERKNEFLRLSRESKSLKVSVPQEYEGYSEKTIFRSNAVDGLKTTITKIAQFESDDALLFFGSIHNSSSKTIYIGSYNGLLKIGSSRSYPPNILRTNKQHLRPNETATFEGLLIGDGNDQPLHLSLNNDFIFHLSKTK